MFKAFMFSEVACNAIPDVHNAFVSAEFVVFNVLKFLIRFVNVISHVHKALVLAEVVVFNMFKAAFLHSVAVTFDVHMPRLC